MPHESKQSLAQESLIARIILGIALVLGLGIRLWIVFHDQGTYWADEIFQSFEPAHKLVFGYGTLPWEYIEGVRSWIFPSIFAAIMKVSVFLGAKAPWQYLGIIRVLLVVNAMASIVGVYLLAKRMGAKYIPAALAAAFFALWPVAIYFSFRAFSEVVSTSFVVFGFWFMNAPKDRTKNSIIGMVLLSLAVFLRLQDIVFPLIALAIPLVKKEWTISWKVLATFAVCILLFGFIDKVTWGSWFHSAITYLEFQAKGGSNGWGMEPFYYYWDTLRVSLSWSVPVLFVLTILSVRKAPIVATAALAFILVHSKVDHKELRFIYPALPLLAACIGIGLSEILSMIKRPMLTYVLGVVLFICMLIAFRHPLVVSAKDVDLRGFDATQSITTAYGHGDSENRLLWAAYKQADICGIKLDTGMVGTGGTAYLHRNVFIFNGNESVHGIDYYNYQIVTLPVPANSTVISTSGNRALIKHAASACLIDPTYVPAL